MKNLLLFILTILLSTVVFSQSTSFLEFDGNDSYYIVDASNKLDVNDDDAWTLETWIYPTANTVPSSGTFPAIISRKYSVELYFRNTGSGTSHLGVGIIALNGSGTGFGIEASLSSETNELALDKWHHVAASYDGTTTRLFFNGTEVGSSTDADFDLDASSVAMNFGCRYDGGYERYINDCALDEIRFSKTARYTSNFTIATTSSEFSTDANTILLYHLDENSGTSLDNDNDADFDATLRASTNDPGWRAWDYYGSNGNLNDDQNLPLDGSLPVELTTFTVRVIENSVKLDWQTATEVNNYGFNVERKLGTEDWNKVGFVKGHGNSNSTKNYSYSDNSVAGGIYSYRLKQVDIDGTFEYSNIVEVNIEIPVSYNLSENYPNPFNPTTTIKFSIPESQFVSLNVFNILGEKVANLVNENKAVGTYTITFDAEDLNSGIYFYQIQTENFIKLKKMMLVK